MLVACPGWREVCAYPALPGTRQWLAETDHPAMQVIPARPGKPTTDIFCSFVPSRIFPHSHRGQADLFEPNWPTPASAQSVVQAACQNQSSSILDASALTCGVVLGE